MKNRLVLSATIILLICFFPPMLIMDSYAQIYRHYSSQHGLQSENIHHILQDHKGLIWISTDSGVHRFNGLTFEYFTTDDGLGSNEVFFLVEDSEQRLWFLSYDGNPSFYKDGKFHNPENTPFLQQLVSKEMFTSYYLDNNNNLWLAADNNQLFKVVGENVSTIPVRDSRPNRIRTIWEDDEKLFVYLDNILGEYDGDQINTSKLIEYFIENYSRSYSGTNTNLISFSEGIKDLVTQEIIVSNKQPTVPSHLIFSSSVLLENGYLWAGTRNDGVWVFDTHNDNQVITSFLPDEFAGRVFLDNQDNIWVSTLNNGIFLFSDVYGKNKHYTNQNGLRSSNILALSRYDNDSVVAGDDRGNVYLINDEISTLIQEGEDNQIFRIDHIKQLDDEKLLVASPNSLRYYENGKVQPLKITLSDREFNIVSIKSMHHNNEDKIFMAGSHYLLEMEYTDSTFSPKILVNGRFTSVLPLEYVFYLSSNSGIRKFNPATESVTNIDDYPDLTALSYDIKLIDDDHIAFTTYRSGIVIQNRNSGKYKTINRNTGLASNLTRKIYVESETTFWVTSTNGLSRVTHQNGDVEEIVNLDHTNGLLSTNINDILITENHLWVATLKGLTRLDLPLETPEPKQIPFLITDFSVNDISQNFQPDISFHHRENNVNIVYNALFYQDPERIRYRYSLDNQMNWQPTQTSELRLLELSPGYYNLALQAYSDDYNISSEIITLDFSITPPFWKTNWFQASTGSVILILFSLLVLVSNKKVKARERRKLEVLREKTELKHRAISAMMNPHFIFNALNSIRYYMLNKTPEEASNYLLKFSKLIRMQLSSSFEERITLEEELERIELYVAVEKNRLEQSLSLEIALDDNIEPDDIFVPSLILQPFVENSIWHGIQPSGKPGEIRITIDQETENLLSVKIEDNGVGLNSEYTQKDSSDDHQSLAISLITQRLALLSEESGTPYEIAYQNKSGIDPDLTGTIVRIGLPV